MRELEMNKNPRDFIRSADLAIYVRDEIDKYSGAPLPTSFVTAFKDIIAVQKYRNMVFKGDGYSRVFIEKLRPYRVEYLRKAIPSLPDPTSGKR